jgi:hypothetical protein
MHGAPPEPPVPPLLALLVLLLLLAEAVDDAVDVAVDVTDAVAIIPPAPPPPGITSPGALMREQAPTAVDAKKRPVKAMRRMPQTRKGLERRQEDGVLRCRRPRFAGTPLTPCA